MKKFELTDEQHDAVFCRGRSVLVSAAAGSGKTRVLTERLMEYVVAPENPQDIDRFLVITYTRAAAAELRGRILKALSERSNAQPENRRLRRQVTLCYSAPIGTIHSFCTSILRENFHVLGLSPDFRVGDEELCAKLKNRALEKVLDAAYEKMDELPGFSELVGSVGAGADDSRLAQTVSDLHAKMLSHPFPEKWAREQFDLYASGDVSMWEAEILSSAKQTVAYWCDSLDALTKEIYDNEQENEALIKAYFPSIEETSAQMRALRRALDIGWDKAREQFPIDFPRLGSLKKFDHPERQEAVKNLRDGCKAAMKSLMATLDLPMDELKAQIERTRPSMQALLSLTLEFDRQYSAEKRRRSILDFSDLEHFAVKLLYDENSCQPTGTAKSISERFTEIMVDEYQDVSAVQDLIFRCISKDDSNIFMVGDVKQSIYRFRLADPTLFLEKYHSFSKYDPENAENCCIMLRRNFRSDSAVLNACNEVFQNIMSPALGEIEYDENAALRPAKDGAAPKGKVTMSLVPVPQAPDDEERPDKTAIEAEYIAQTIEKLVSSGETIPDGDGERPIRFGDIAILMRSHKNNVGIYTHALSRHGIPVFSEQGSDFFTRPEIVVMTSFLSVVDNPHRDVPLASALCSPMFGFTADDMTCIRSCDKSADFYSALCLCAKEDEKCGNFLEFLNETRKLSQNVSVRELINHIYDELDLPAVWVCAAKSRASCDSLMTLSDLAEQYESGGYRGLGGFLENLSAMQERGTQPQGDAGISSDCVSIMSIHKSKGLEFPVVFLADTARKFNMQDTIKPVLVHPTIGIGGKVTDTKRGIEFPTIAHRAIKSRLTFETLSENMRVLYVAMTRAKQRLYITGTCADPEGYIQKHSGEKMPISPVVASSCRSFEDWLALVALSGECKSLSFGIACKAEEEVPAESVSEGSISVDPEILEALRQNLSFRYKYAEAAELPSKLTATMLPDEETDSEAAELLPRPRSFRLPDLSGGDRKLTAAERGTATHLVLQFIDFSKTGSKSWVSAEVQRISALGLLTPAQAKAVDVGAVTRFFASGVGQRIKSADSVLREFRFSVLCPAEKYYDVSPGEELLLQGVVDCCIEEAGKLTIIDYKTDYVTDETLDAVAGHYKKQLRAYAWAMEQITKKPVTGCILCFVRADRFVEFLPE